LKYNEKQEGIKDNAPWREDQPAQQSVPRANLMAAVRDILTREHHQV